MDISVVIPVYNSFKILDELSRQLEKELSAISNNYEIIFVNDFSPDKSWSKIVDLSKQNKFIKGINLKKNYGQHNAILAGLNYVSGSYIILMDDDLQHNPSYIQNIISELKKDHDVCYVKYLKRKHVLWKKSASWFNNLTASILTNKPVSIYTSSFKGFNNKICKNIILTKKSQVFLDWLILDQTNKISVIEVLHNERYSGVTNYDLKKLFSLWSVMILNIVPKKKLSSVLLFFLKLLINVFSYIFIKKKDIKEQFSILEKTF